MSGLATLEAHNNLWRLVQQRRAKQEMERLRPPLIRLWDGDINLRGVVAGERAGSFEFIENDTGTAFLQLSLDHYLAKWVMNHRGRAKRNVHVSFDKQGARWFGCMTTYRVVREENGDAYLEINFKHDYEQAKHILCWVCPPLLTGRGVGLAAIMSKSILKAGAAISKIVDHFRSGQVVPVNDVICQPITARNEFMDTT
ncbi:hypothetical protein [Mycobacteroides abscessus]|uniref:Gp37-like protein n=1 Tax=Mycobacteroides abscessus TaxID=36809 RepID=UPI001F21B6A4|nr:hypothetical protein [Mycobacteroides abscessus]